jgi:hypothetical protein
VSFEIIRRKAAGGINFTASHNPPLYNGLKFSPAWGGRALKPRKISKQEPMRCSKRTISRRCLLPMPRTRNCRRGRYAQSLPRRSEKEDRW